MSSGASGEHLRLHYYAGSFYNWYYLIFDVRWGGRPLIIKKQAKCESNLAISVPYHNCIAQALTVRHRVCCYWYQTAKGFFFQVRICILYQNHFMISMEYHMHFFLNLISNYKFIQQDNPHFISLSYPIPLQKVGFYLLHHHVNTEWQLHT